MSTTSASTAPAPERLAARAEAWRYLAACWYEPSSAFAEEGLFASLAWACAQVDAGLAAQARRLGESFSAVPLESLLVDYSRLFLLPGEAAARPYASAWLTSEKALMQESTLAVSAAYAEAGFEVDEGFRDLPDHVAAELEFVYLLDYRVAQARALRDAAAEDVAANVRNRFLERHLARWVDPFAQAVRAAAQTAFYAELARLTSELVRRESATPRSPG